MLVRGAKGGAVKDLQLKLNMKGAKLVVDGSFGIATERAVKEFQSKNGLQSTGIVDSNTLVKLNEIGNKPLYSKLRFFDSDVHVLSLGDGYRLDVDFGVGKKLERPSTILANIRKNNKKAVAVVNCGFFNFDGKNEHLGLYIDEGLYYNPPSSNFVDFEYYKDGHVEVKNITTQDIGYLSNLQKSCHWAIGSSYALLINGVKSKLNQDKFDHSKSRNPRTLLGWSKEKGFILVVVDGRNGVKSKGVTADQSSDIMQTLGCYHAVNLDGGGSSSMSVFEKNAIVVKNRPSDKTERAVGSVLVVYEN